MSQKHSNPPAGGTIPMGRLPTEDAALVLLFGLIVSGRIRLRRLDGWQQTPAVLRARREVAARRIAHWPEDRARRANPTSVSLRISPFRRSSVERCSVVPISTRGGRA